MTDTDRLARLARLAELGARPELGAKASDVPEVKRTGDEVYAGGEEARLLIGDAHLVYKDGTDLVHAFASPGDVVLLSVAQAKRLDALGVTVSADAAEEEVAEATTSGTFTDEQLAAMTAADLVAHVGQHPEDKARVRTLELARAEDKRRSTVLEATKPADGEDDPDEELDPEE